MSNLPNQAALVSESTSVGFNDLSAAAAALQKQASRDFGPIWSVNATVDAFDKLESVPVDYWPVILKDDIKEPGAAGYHTDENGQPFALVQVDDGWTLTASHETLEMLADPHGNRTIAGPPPTHSPAPANKFKRVLYLVEVADPCEGDQFAYEINGIKVSDFLTPNYYDHKGSNGVRYSFTGAIASPHTVLEAGYVSFGNPVDNEWYQIVVEDGKTQLRKLGKLNREGRSLRETIDAHVRHIQKDRYYRTARPTAARAAAAGTSGISESSEARAKTLR